MPAHHPDSPRYDSTRAPRWLRLGFWICIAISMAVVLRRIYALAAPSRDAPPQLAELDNLFASHAALTLAHIVPALLFVLFAPVIVFRQPSRSVPWAHYAFYLFGTMTGLTAYAMSVFSIGGWIERSAVLVFDTFFVLSLVLAWTHRRRGDILLERRWQLRAIAILLGIATTRPVMGVFFATAQMTHLVPQQFFGIAFWIGFSINVLVFELWIRSVDHRRRLEVGNADIRSTT